MSNEIDGLYFDAQDGQSFIQIANGTYTVEHEHLTEEGNVVVSGSKIEFEITSGDYEGAPPYNIEITNCETSELNADFVAYLGQAFVSAVNIRKNGEPFLNDRGLFAKCADDGTLDID